MDNLCHTLTGAAFGEAGLKRTTRFALPVLIVASNLPDVDVLIYATGSPAVQFRRGWTHGVLAQTLLPLILTAAVFAIARFRPRRGDTPPVRLGAVLALSYLGVILHVLMDWLNTYGVRLLMPFSGRWFYGDAVYIVDPWLWIILGAGVLVARRRGFPAPARKALAIAAMYVFAMVGSAKAAKAVVLDQWIVERSQPPEALMVGPAPFDPFRKMVIVDSGDRYERGTFRWFGKHLSLDGPSILTRESDPAVVRARQYPTIRAILVWARFPYYQLAPAQDGTRVTVRDMRFGARVGSASVVVPRN